VWSGSSVSVPSCGCGWLQHLKFFWNPLNCPFLYIDNLRPSMLSGLLLLSNDVSQCYRHNTVNSQFAVYPIISQLFQSLVQFVVQAELDGWLWAVIGHRGNGRHILLLLFILRIIIPCTGPYTHSVRVVYSNHG